MKRQSRPLAPRPTFLLLVIGSLALSAADALAAKTIRQFGITWTFDRDYPTGQFANGDYWIVGPAKLVQIHPASVTRHGVTMHGSMLNPAVNAPAQGYDSRIKNNPYSPAANAATRLPLVLAPGTSLLSSESHAAGATKDNPQLKTIAILTVLAAPPPPGSFRPSYLAADKRPRWNVNQLRYDRLRSLPRVAHAPSPRHIADNFARPWIEQRTNWSGRYLHPSDNQPAYGREIAHTLAEGLLALQLDYSAAEKKELLVRLVQYGLDIYGAAAAGACWHADGAHNHGRKMPLLLAGHLLDDPALLAYADGGKRRIFQEDQQTWYVTAADVGRVLFTADRRPRDRYLPSDIGLAEWGEKHAGDPSRDGRNWDAYYRAVAGSSTIGHVLAARLMGLQDEWNWPATFDYYDRYWTHEQRNVSRGANSIQPFVAEMWRKYRNATPAKLSDANVATPIWHNLTLPPQSGSFTVSFDLLASTASMEGITGLSHGDAKSADALVAAVRLAPTGVIEARDGDRFRAARVVRYVPGEKYRVVITLQPASGWYAVTITPPGGAPVRIAEAWRLHKSFRPSVLLDRLGFHSASGSHAVLNLGVQPDQRQSPPIRSRVPWSSNSEHL